MKLALEDMFIDPDYNMGARSVDKEDYIEKHLNYVSRYPYIDSRQYINNLKIKSRV